MTRDLDGREYKLLLDPGGVGADEAAVDAFYGGRLRELLGRGEDRKVKGEFGAPKLREIDFFDTPVLLLDGAGYALRRRSRDGEAEVTLKLRQPNFFVVAATGFEARDDEAETSFEEDIAPLEVMTQDGEVKIADPPSIRSRFALSSKQPLRGGLDTLAAAFDLYPTLEKNLRRAGCGGDPSTRLLRGPDVRERVFAGPKVDFGHEVVAEVVVTLWDLSPPAVVSRVAEISFRCDTNRGRMPGKAARAALDLFIDLQRELDVEVRYPSKTKLALPVAGLETGTV